MSIILLVALDACHSLVNPDLSLCIIAGIISSSRVANDFAYIFKSKFKRDMGHTFWGAVGSLPGLGRVIISAFNDSLGNNEEEAVSLNNVVRCGASWCEYCL